jgi:hypothetical protein
MNRFRSITRLIGDPRVEFQKLLNVHSGEHDLGRRHSMIKCDAAGASSVVGTQRDNGVANDLRGPCVLTVRQFANLPCVET